MANVLKDEGNKLMSENRPLEAIAKYTEAISVAGSSHLLLSNRSAAYAKAAMWKEALEDAEACLSLNEKFDKGYARKAGALMGMKNFKEAYNVCKAGLQMCPDSETIKTKLKELEQIQQPQQPSPMPASTSCGLLQRFCGYLTPFSFGYLMYSIVLSFSSDNAGDVREMFLIMAAHMLIGLFAKHGVASYQTLKTIYQRVREPPKEWDSSVAKLIQMQHEDWLHYLLFAVILSNATFLFPRLFILATIFITSSHVVLYTVAKRTFFLPEPASNVVNALLKNVESMSKKQIPYLEVAISFGLITDVFTPHRSLLATVMYFWIFKRQRLTPIPMHILNPTLYRKPFFAHTPTYDAWSNLNQKLTSLLHGIPYLSRLHLKVSELAKKFVEPQGVAGRQ